MKKMKIVSLLLAAVMTASSLPIVVSAEDNDSTQAPVTVGEELLSGFTDASKWSGNVEKVTVDTDGENTYLYYPQAVASLVRKINFTLAKALDPSTSYQLIFKAGAPVTGAGESRTRFTLKHGSTVIDINTASSATDTAGTTKTLDLAAVKEEKIAFKPATTINAGETLTLEIRGHNVFYAITPRMLDDLDIVLWGKTESMLKAQSGDIGNVASISDGFEKITETDYIRVAAIEEKASVEAVAAAANNGDYNAAAVYSTDITLTPGIYELTFDARQSYFFANSNHNQHELEYEYQKKLEAAGEGATREGVQPDKGYREVDLKTDGLKRLVANKDGKYRDSAVLEKYSGDTTYSTKVYHALYTENSGYNVANYRDVKVVLSTGSGVIKEETVKEITNEWGSHTVLFAVPFGETVTLSKISFGGTGKAYDNDAFDIMNASLKLVTESVDNIEIESGILDSEDLSIDNAIPMTANGYLRIGERPDDGNKSANFLKLTIDEKPVAGRKYYISYDITGTQMPDKTEQRIRHTVNFNTVCEASSFNKYIKGETGVETDSEFPILGTTSRNGWYESALTNGKTYHFVGYFIPAEGVTASNIEITINRSDSAARDRGTITIDNLKVWYEGGSEPIYENEFNSKKNLKGISGNKYEGVDYTVEIVASEEYNVYTPIDGNKPMQMTYQLDGVEAEVGTYSFSTAMKLESAPSKPATATVVFTFADNTTREKTIDIGTEFSTLSDSLFLEDASAVTGITIVINSDVPVMLGDPLLTLEYRAGGTLNIGILMVLLMKKQHSLVEDPVPAVPNGYLRISERPNDSDKSANFFKLTIDEKPVAGRKYYISYDITGTQMPGSSAQQIRQTVNFNTEYGADSLNKFIDDSEGSTLTAEKPPYSNNWVKSSLEGNKLYHFVGYFVPASGVTAENIQITINRSDSHTRDRGAITMDNLKIWYESNGEIVYIYDNDFDSEDALKGISGNQYAGVDYTIEQVFPE